MKKGACIACIIFLCVSLVALTCLIWYSLIKLDLLPFLSNQQNEKFAEKIGNERDLIAAINNNQSATWTAIFNPSALLHKPIVHDLALVQSKNDESWRNSLQNIKVNRLMTSQNQLFGKPNLSMIPVHFDAREKWHYCQSIHKPNQEQGSCGSCWAVAGASVISDRICIHSKGTVQVDVSAEDILNCNIYGASCDGGELWNPFQHWASIGVVTGGGYGSGEGCRPYGHSSECGVPCAYWQFDSAKECQLTCQDNYTKEYIRDKYYGQHVYYITGMDNQASKESHSAERVQRLQWELMTRGPVSASFLVPQDLLHYDSGVYQHFNGGLIYPHAIRLVGWGEENGIPYWLAANSFGTNWGLNGFFKIIRGINHLNIELEAFAAMPRNEN